jgi:hypothetical protein
VQSGILSHLVGWLVMEENETTMRNEEKKN